MTKKIKIQLTEGQYKWFQDNSEIEVDCDKQTNSIIVSDVFDKDKRVHDCVRYKFTKHEYGSIVDYAPLEVEEKDLSSWYIDKKYNVSDELKTILLLLESPHKEEYYSFVDENHHLQLRPLSPAQGVTGYKIDKLLLSKLEDYVNSELIEGSYQIVISNPVQFQTSLHCLHRKSMSINGGVGGRIRNSVWRMLMKREVCNFKARMNIYSPKVIINACTAALKVDMDDILKDFYKNDSDKPLYYLASKHPCVWTETTTLRKAQMGRLHRKKKTPPGRGY